MAWNYSNTFMETTLTGSVTPSATTISVASTSGLPVSFPFTLIVDFEQVNVEVVTVTSLAGSNLTVVRGQDGTAAQSHSLGARVVHGVVARDVREPQEHIDATQSVHGVGASNSVVGTGTTQTLTNKTINGLNNTLSNIPSAAITQPFASLEVTGDLTVGGKLIANGPEMVVFTSSGSFIKANYPWARRIKVRVQGAGGGGGGCVATGVGATAVAGGGGGGGYGEKWIGVAALSASEAVTVGTGGAGGTTAGTGGSQGGTSTFGAHCSASGGVGGEGSATATSSYVHTAGGTGGAGQGGDLNIEGGDGTSGARADGRVFTFGCGGGSVLGGQRRVDGTDAGADGLAGHLYGGGGAGGNNADNQATARVGGAGANGVVIVEVFM